jgi:ParB family chromosome partitioning protein
MDAFKIKKGLGRGLSSLIGDIKVNSNINKLLITDLVRNKLQPRKNFDKESLEDLANSIKERGLIQPIIVRKSDDNKNKYEIIAGERRWLASQNAGLHEIPVVITEASDLKSLEFAIVENVQRHDLNSIEEANGYQRLIDDFGYDHEKVAKFIGKSRSHISNCLRLLTLPKEVIHLIEKNSLSQGHAKVLVGLSNAFFLAKKIVDKKLSVRQAENLVRLFKSKKITKYISKDPNLKQIESTLKDKIGLNIFIKNKKNNTGFISFEYKDYDQLNRIIDVIKSNY